MKVLWIVNITFPEAQKLLDGQGSFKSSGGWLLASADILSLQPSVDLTIASVSRQVKTLTCLKGKRITYYLLPFGKGNVHINNEYKPFWRKIFDEIHPDVVHIHGTEFSHGLAYLKACGCDHVCVSIQGLTYACYEYYCSGLTLSEIFRAITPISMLRGTILKERKVFKRRGEYEKDILSRVHHIIGRTSWDHDRTKAINPNATYHQNNEILRPEFNSDLTWSYEKCVPHTIFISQASYPIKGLHQLIRALPLVLREYPDTIVRIAGENICRDASWKDLLRQSNYGRLLCQLIKKNNLENRICFVGSLSGEEMRSEYLRSNVFVCPSSIENSPNSLAEAQVLGVPVIASYVGGIPDMMCGDEKHLFRFEEVDMLARLISDTFNMGNNINNEHMCSLARKRHDSVLNTERLLNIYEYIIGE